MTQFQVLLVFLGSLGAFLTSIGIFLMQHKDWSTVTSTEGVGHILLIIGTFAITLYSALKYQLPRSFTDDYRDRATDKVVDINRKGSDR